MATIVSLLRDHVTLRVRSVDRIFLAAYVPKLQCEGQVVRFLLSRGYVIPSPAGLGKIGQAYVRAIEDFAVVNRIPIVRFAKGTCKEDVARSTRARTSTSPGGSGPSPARTWPTATTWPTRTTT